MDCGRKVAQATISGLPQTDLGGAEPPGSHDEDHARRQGRSFRVGKIGPMQDRAGEVIAGTYRLERLLGTAAVGDLYHATHVGTQARAALRLIDPNLSLGADAPVRLARIAAEITRLGG